jgi:hypothetical protein
MQEDRWVQSMVGWEKLEVTAEFWWGSLLENIYWEGLGDERIILKMDLRLIVCEDRTQLELAVVRWGIWCQQCRTFGFCTPFV